MTGELERSLSSSSEDEAGEGSGDELSDGFEFEDSGDEDGGFEFEEERKEREQRRQLTEEARAERAARQLAAASWAKSLTDSPFDVAIAIARALDTPRDMLRLSMACKRYRIKVVADPAHHCGMKGPPEMWSIAQEAARCWVVECSAAERGWIGKGTRGRWLGLMQNLRRAGARQPLAFAPYRIAPYRTSLESWYGANASDDRDDPFRLSEGDTVVTHHGHARLTAATRTAVMLCSGRHFAQFTVVSGQRSNFGVIQPEGSSLKRHDDGEDKHCFVGHDGTDHPRMHWISKYPDHPSNHSGKRGKHHKGWEGKAGFGSATTGDRIGMLLDLQQGSMTVYKNGTRLGVMQPSGLKGPYYWAVALAKPNSNGPAEESVRIESAPVPPSPTPEELAAAVAWQAAHPVAAQH